MAPVARSVWHRLKHSVADEVAARSSDAEVEILRQLADVFKELARLSVDLGAVFQSLGETNGKLDALGGKLDAQALAVAELTDTVNEQIELGNESTELLGRLLQSARARLDALDAGHGAPTSRS